MTKKIFRSKLIIAVLLLPLLAGSCKKTELIWEYQTEGKQTSIAFLHDSKLFVLAGEYLEQGSPNHLLYCLDSNTGKLLWKQDAGKLVITSTPVLDNKKIYWTTVDGKTLVLDIATGKIIKKTKILKKKPDKGKTDTAQKYQAEGNTLSCFDENSGVVLWEIKKTGTIEQVQSDGTYVYFATAGDRNIWCINEATGKDVWHYTVKKVPHVKNPNAVNFSYTVKDNKLYIANYDGTISMIAIHK